MKGERPKGVAGSGSGSGHWEIDVGPDGDDAELFAQDDYGDSPAYLDIEDLRKLAAKCTEIADWLERGECDHSEARPTLGQFECVCGATWPEEPDDE